MRRIKEIIALLKEFKEHTDKLGSEKDVTISLILPVFDYFQTDILAINAINGISVVVDSDLSNYQLFNN